MSRLRASCFLLASCTLACFGMACAAGGLPPTHYYTLGPPEEPLEGGHQAADWADSEGLAIAVESLDVAPPYDQDRIVYRESTDSSEVGFYAYHRWAAPLGRLAQATLMSGLEGIPGIRAVGAMGSGSQFGAVLGGRILHIEEIAGSDGSAGSADRAGAVRLAFELELRSPSGETLWADGFAGSEAGVFADGGEVARALHRLFERLVVDAGRGLQKVAETLAADER